MHAISAHANKTASDERTVLCFSTLHPYMFMLNSYLYLDKGLGFCVTAMLTCLSVCVYLKKRNKMYLLFNKTINNIEVGCSYLAFTIHMSEK